MPFVRLILVALCLSFLPHAAEAGPSNALAIAERAFEEGRDNNDILALKRAVALTNRAVDALYEESYLLRGKAYYHIALLYHYNKQDDKSAEYADKAGLNLRRANSGAQEMLEARQYGLLVNIHLLDTLGVTRNFIDEEQMQRDYALLNRAAPTDELTVYLLAKRALAEAQTSNKPEEYEEASRLFRRLMSLAPENSNYQAYHLYSRSKAGLMQASEAIAGLTQLVQRHPENTLFRYLRGQI